MFRVVQLRKYSLNSRCCPSSCLLAVLAMFLAVLSLVLSLETSEISASFVFTTKTTQPRRQIFLAMVNGALNGKKTTFLMSSVD